MSCSLCTGVAIYRAAGKGYCKAHQSEAKAESIRLGSAKTGAGATISPYATKSNDSQEQQNKHDEQDKADSATPIVTKPRP